ncbi:hypothetical protein GGH99_001118, partial [Coemansia sp. RSA 1285]
GVPDLDGLVAGRRDDLTVVRRERDRKDILVVANEAAGGLAGVDVPQAQGLVPRGRQNILAVRGNGNVLDKVVVALQRALGNAVVAVIASQRPDNQGLVTGGRDKNVGVLDRGGKSSDLTAVA